MSKIDRDQLRTKVLKQALSFVDPKSPDRRLRTCHEVVKPGLIYSVVSSDGNMVFVAEIQGFAPEVDEEGIVMHARIDKALKSKWYAYEQVSNVPSLLESAVDLEDERTVAIPLPCGRFAQVERKRLDKCLKVMLKPSKTDNRSVCVSIQEQEDKGASYLGPIRFEQQQGPVVVFTYLMPCRHVHSLMKSACEGDMEPLRRDREKQAEKKRLDAEFLKEAVKRSAGVR